MRMGELVPHALDVEVVVLGEVGFELVVAMDVEPREPP